MSEAEPNHMLRLIEDRTSVFPNSFIDKPIETEKLERLMQLADSAPTHRLTQPWRFKIVRSSGLPRLSLWLADQYRKVTDASDFSEKKFTKTKQKVLRSGAVIIICMQRDPKKSVPEWEEIAAVACAVQNIWIACGMLGLGGYWSSPKTIEYMNEFTSLADGERCLGLFYLGHHNQPPVPKNRTPWQQKVAWINV